jgi:oligopeptide/dipeptide ABC transporter ATP-binding protein
MNTVLDVERLTTYFFLAGQTVRAVDGVSFGVRRGETLAVVGESGCGKSQTALSLMRLISDPPGKIMQGRVTLEGRDLLTLKEEEMRRVRGNEMSMIFQEPMNSLNPVFTVGYQLSEALLLHNDMSEHAAEEESIRLLSQVGISDPADRISEYPFQLSGGLRQRVMIAMAMACDPSVLLADEPTTALDVTIQAQILRLMGDLKQRHETAIVFITHDLAIVAGFTDRVMVMYAGVVVEEAPVRELFKRPLHPYTEGLLGSVPVMGERKVTADGSRRFLRTIPGTLPEQGNLPSGCRFAPRCPKVMSKCWEAEPALVELESGHTVRCFLHSDEVEQSSAYQETYNEVKRLQRYANR